MALADCASTPAPPPQQPMAHAPIRAYWIFSHGDACTATAATALMSLDIVASPSQVSLSVRRSGHRVLPRNGTRIDVAGASGNWSVTAHGASHHKATFTEPMSEDAANRIRVLLSGGVVHFGELGDGVPALNVPPGGDLGHAWFECVRQKLKG